MTRTSTGDSIATPKREVLETSSRGFSKLADGIRDAYHRIIGIPDYQAYLRHMSAHHPGQPCLSQREFFNYRIDCKYRGKGPRCC
jgi:uncharacterized short protein YbdD (DUF466 family)